MTIWTNETLASHRSCEINHQCQGQFFFFSQQRLTSTSSNSHPPTCLRVHFYFPSDTAWLIRAENQPSIFPHSTQFWPVHPGFRRTHHSLHDTLPHGRDSQNTSSGTILQNSRWEILAFIMSMLWPIYMNSRKCCTYVHMLSVRI